MVRNPSHLLRWTITFFIFALLLLPWPPVAASAEPEKQKVQLPRELGEPRSINVAPSIGAVSDSIPLIVSPGRHNVEPRLSLMYSSMAGPGKVGVGWDMELGRIERWRGDGSPSALPEEDAFLYALQGAGGELRHTGDGLYRAKIESIYREFRRSDHGGWEMLDGEGNLHRFGGNPESRIPDRVWLLDLVRDRHGNTITYTYSRVNGVLYPDTIRYTGFEDDPGRNSVIFEYEERPDHRISYANGVLEKQTLRLRRVSMFAGDSLARRYEPSYEESPLNGQSFLQRITLVGADDLSRITLRTIAYTSRSLDWTGIVSNTLPCDLAVKDGDGYVETGAKILDVNGDGFADAVDNGESVWLGDGQGGFELSPEWSGSLQAAGIRFVGEHGADNGVRLLDVDGDQRPDILIAQPGLRRVLLNTGKGWEYNQQWSDSLESLDEQATAYADLDFMDGTPSGCDPPHCDWLPQPIGACLPPHCTGTAGDPPNCLQPHCSEKQVSGCRPDHCSPASYSDLFEEVFALVDGDNDSKGVQFADVNGDGRVDILWSMSRKETLFWMLGRVPVHVRGVFLNTGAGWVSNETLTGSLAGFEFVTDTETQGYDVLDVNGDGLADILQTMEGKTRTVHLGTGRGWVYNAGYSESLAASHILSISRDRKGLGLMPADFNDDGLIDYLRSNQTTIAAYRNNGTGWVESSEMTEILVSLSQSGMAFNSPDGMATGAALTDIDGDGVTDYVVAKDGYRWVSLSSRVRSGLLASATSAIGEETHVTWGSSTGFDNRRSDGVQGLPAPMAVATEITRGDGCGNSWTTAYEYGGGLLEDRQFRAFSWSRETRPNGFVITRGYSQEEGLAGQFLSEEGADDWGVRARRTVTYEKRSLAPLPVTQVYLRQIEEETIDPDGSLKSRVENEYDAQLNCTRVLRDPDVSAEGDHTVTHFTWGKDFQAGIWSLPTRITALFPDGTTATDQLMVYEDQERWVLREVRELAAPGVYVSRFMEYDRYGNVTRTTDRLGHHTDYGYDPTATFRTWSKDPEGREVSSSYDPRFGALTMDEDVSGNKTLKVHDAFGRLVKETLPGDERSGYGTRSWAYSSLGSPGEDRQFLRLLETETPGTSEVLQTTTYFNGMGLPYMVEKEGPGVRSILSITRYDDADNAVAVSRPFFKGDAPVFTRIERDAMHRPVLVKDSGEAGEQDGTEMRLRYAGHDTVLLDRRGFETTFTKNGQGQITRISQLIDGVPKVTRYGYDPLGRLVIVVDAMGAETRMTYDPLGRRVRLEDPNAGTYRYSYDEEGRLLSQIGPDGGETAFVYNRAGELVEKKFPDGTSVEFTYGQPGEGNGAGRVVRIMDRAGMAQIAYDSRGNVVERKRTLTDEHLPAVRLRPTYVTGYSYDSMGRIRRITYPDGFAVIYEYDAAGNLARVSDEKGDPIASLGGYTAAGQLNGVEYRNGVVSRFQYNTLQQMTNILTRTDGGVTLQDLQYSYDPGGNILSIQDLDEKDLQTFQYDAVGRLIAARGAYGEESYRYDAIGNLLQKGRQVFTVDPDHLQRVIRQSTVTPKGRLLWHRDRNLVYDDYGNVIRKGQTRYEYDAENHLVGVRGPGVRMINIYDSAGQRVIERSGDGVKVYIDGIYEENRQTAVRHIMAGQMLLATRVTPRAQVRRIEEAPPPMLGSAGPWDRWLPGLPKTGRSVLVHICIALCLATFLQWMARGRCWNRVRKWFGDFASRMRYHPIRGPVIMTVLPVFLIVSSHGVQGEIRLASGATAPRPVLEKWYYYHSNHLGSVHVVTDQHAKVVAKRSYRPYGEPFKWAGHLDGPRELLMTFQGRRYDDNGGLYYFNARHYDPGTGRFLSSDTQVPDPTDPRALHRYAFAGGNPVRYVDPTGHGFWEWVGALFLIVAAAFVGIFTFGVGLAFFGCLAGVLLMTLGAALVGGAIFASIALSRGAEPLSADFWRAAATGLVIGAVIGAGLACLPAAMGSMANVGVLASICSNAVVGAMFGAIQQIVIHFKNGGVIEGLLTAELGIAMGFGALLAAVSTAVLGPLKVAGWTSKAVSRAATSLGWIMKGTGLAGLVHAGFTGRTVMASLESFGYRLFFELLLFNNSPTKSLGVPAWALAGTPFGAQSGTDGLSPYLNTMPLAP